MQRYAKFFTGFLLTLFFTICLPASAADTLNYEKTFTAQALPGDLNYIVLNFYETEGDGIPVASQTFIPGEWQLTAASSVKVPNVDVSYLNNYEKLWVETEFDGVVAGPRALILLTEPGISAGGLIESRIEGFKFPDATVQTTAGATPGDLSSHQGNTSAHHSPSVTTTEIVDGTIAPIDVNQAGNFTIGGLTVDGSSHTYFKSDADIRIHDDTHSFRWYDAAGTTQHAYINVSSGAVSFVDTTRSRTIFNSNSDGIGIDAPPTSSHAVTMPSLNVTGDLEIGLVRVSSAYLVNIFATGCHEHNDDICYRGSGTVQCPVGTRVLGGGTHTSPVTERVGVSGSYPDSDTSWSCSSREDVSNTHNCYAICARLE